MRALSHMQADASATFAAATTISMRANALLYHIVNILFDTYYEPTSDNIKAAELGFIARHPRL